MPADWSLRQDVERLADQGRREEFRVPLEAFPRLRVLLVAQGGEASGVVEVRREDGRPTAMLHVAASVPLVCQRCMGRVDVPLVAESRVVLVAVPAEADRLPEGMESFFAEGGRVALRDLVEEELMLALPLVPRHESSRDCHAQRELQDAALPASGQDIESSLDATQTPFSGLGDLLKRRT